jgi:nucleotide-binding universal stress UspA family protein
MARRRILIGYNGAPQGEDALALGRLMAEALDASASVAIVAQVPRRALEDEELDSSLARFSEPLFATARERLADVQASERTVVHTSPPRALQELAEELQPAVIVIGSAHHGAAGRILLGDVGQAMLSGAPCAVAVAPSGYRDRDQRFTRIGVAVDGSAQSLRALQGGVALAERTEAPVRVLTVNEPHHYMLGGALSPLSREEYESYKEGEAERVLDDALGQMPDGVASERSLLEGPAAEALLEAAQDLDLLVLGSRGYGPIKGALLGSVSTKLIGSASCPVLVLPRGTGADPLGAARGNR